MTHSKEGISILYMIFVALMILLVVTVAAARVDMGRWNFAVAILIAAAKAVLIVLFFMHVRDSVPLTKFVVCAGFIWLAIMFCFSFADYWTRHWPMSGL